MMLCIWQPESKSLILLLFVLLTMRAEDIIAVVAFYNESLSLQRNSTKCISYEINNSRTINTIYKAANMFLNNFYPTWSEKAHVFHMPV